MAWLTVPVDLLSKCLGLFTDVWLTLVFGFLIVPAVFGFSFGIHKYYVRILLSIFEVSLKCLWFEMTGIKDSSFLPFLNAT